MAHLSAAMNLMKKGCSVDLSHAHYTVSSHPNNRKFVEFQWRRPLCADICFANGLANCPGYFTKLMQPVYAYRKTQGFLSSSASFSDDT